MLAAMIDYDVAVRILSLDIPQMENATLVPANFRISQQAQTMLNELTDMASRDTGRPMVPALLEQGI